MTQLDQVSEVQDCWPIQFETVHDFTFEIQVLFSICWSEEQVGVFWIQLFPEVEYPLLQEEMTQLDQVSEVQDCWPIQFETVHDFTFKIQVLFSICWSEEQLTQLFTGFACWADWLDKHLQLDIEYQELQEVIVQVFQLFPFHISLPIPLEILQLLVGLFGWQLIAHSL